jgi:hypothetical protein
MIALVVYHYSSGGGSGCAGHGYDTERARESAVNLVQTLTFSLSSSDLASFHVVLFKFESDHEMLSLESVCGTHSLDSVDMLSNTSDAILSLYPHLPASVIRDLRPLVVGNGERVLAYRARPRQKLPAECEHAEKMIFIGSAASTDWLSTVNFALCLDDADPRLGDALAAAANIVLRNLEREEAAGERAGGLIVCAIAYDNLEERNAAITSARYLTRMSKDVLARSHSAVIADVFQFVTAVTTDTRKLEIVRD